MSKWSFCDACDGVSIQSEQPEWKSCQIGHTWQLIRWQIQALNLQNSAAHGGKDGHELVVSQLDTDRFPVGFICEHIHVELSEIVVAEVNFGQREPRETAGGELLKAVVAQIQTLQVTQLGQSIRAYLQKEKQRGAKWIIACILLNLAR